MNKPFTPLKVSTPVRSRPLEEIRGERKVRVRTGSRSVYSPSPDLPTAQREVWQILIGGLHSLSENDFGRPWPYPVRRRLARLVSEYDAELCIRAAREAREIVQSQDRAPNITGLFEKKLRDLAAEHAYRMRIRSELRTALAAGGESP
jgi:hypothetical protein